MSAIGHHSGIRKTAWMLYKCRSGLYHPYFYANRENAEKQIGWFGDEIHRVRITRVKELTRKKSK